MDAPLFNTNFIINEIDRDGKQFDNVRRIFCKSENNDSDLILDINSQIYDKIRIGMVFSLCIAKQITSEVVDEKAHWHPSQLQNSLATNYEYVMHGKVYRYEEDSAHHKASVFVSFGGLLMKLVGDPQSLADIPRGRNVYLLIREIKST